jgi:hypothetical protein
VFSILWKEVKRSENKKEGCAASSKKAHCRRPHGMGKERDLSRRCFCGQSVSTFTGENKKGGSVPVDDDGPLVLDAVQGTDDGGGPGDGHHQAL